MHRTKTEAALAEAELAHANDPERSEVLRRARQFKASWLELGEALTGVKRSGNWQGWGYDSFEAYAKSELRLKPDTVDKLTGSFTFLQRRAPAVLARDALREPIPSYQAVDFLRRAEASEGAPREAIAEVRRRVLEEGAPAATVVRQYRDVVFPIDEGQRRAREAAGIKNVATRLRELLAETHSVPRKLVAEVDGALDRLLGALAQDAEHAA
ncbi:MAG: hypothetical protein ACLP1X_17800 [Polyangiaceae bacterium]